MRKVLGISALIFTALCLLTYFLELYTYSKIGLICLFAVIALFLQYTRTMKGITFTVVVITAVIASMSFPQYFTHIGSFDTKATIVPLLIIIMFGMGTSMSFSDFAGVMKMPRSVLIGVICQFSIMPFIGWSLASISGLPPEIAAGIILVGCSPSGLASNVMAFISGANLALSVTLTAVATLLAPLVTPFLMKMLADQLVPIDFWEMWWSIIKIVILPILGGLIFHRIAHGRFPWIGKILPVISMAGIAIIITVITAAGRDDLLSIGLILIGVVFLHNIAGYSLGYWLSRLFRLDRRSARTVAFEVGMQNSGLASGIALEMGRVATMGLAPAVFGPLMNVTGSSLATFWKSRITDETEHTQ